MNGRHHMLIGCSNYGMLRMFIDVYTFQLQFCSERAEPRVFIHLMSLGRVASR